MGYRYFVLFELKNLILHQTMGLMLPLDVWFRKNRIDTVRIFVARQYKKKDGGLQNAGNVSTWSGPTNSGPRGLFALFWMSPICYT